MYVVHTVTTSNFICAYISNNNVRLGSLLSKPKIIKTICTEEWEACGLLFQNQLKYNVNASRFPTQFSNLKTKSFFYYGQISSPLAW